MTTAEPEQPADEPNPDDAQVQFPNHTQKIIVIWVFAVGAFGGLFIKFVPIKGIDVSTFSWWQSLLVGAIGAFLTVFYVAKTDLRKFWNVICVALLAGISGPSVIEAIITPAAPRTSASVANDAAKSASQLQEKAKSSDPSAFQNTVDDTTQKAATSLQLFKVANQAHPEGKKEELAKTEESLKEVLQNLDQAADHSPTKILPAVAQIGNLAKESGADAVASQAQQIISKAQSSDKRAVKEAASAPDVSKDSVKIYFVTPGTLTDSMLSEIQSQISALFPMFSIQPTAHPKRQMEPGVEVVYYNLYDAAAAQKVLEFVKKYTGAGNGTTRLGKTDDGSQPSQIDIHIGPDLAAKWPANPPVAPTAEPPASAMPSVPQASPSDHTTKRKSKRKA